MPPFWTRKTASKYELVTDDICKDINNTRFSAKSSVIKLIFGSVITWVILTTCFASLSAFQLVEKYSKLRGLGSYEGGFTTEYISDHPEIELKLVRFSGTPRYFDNGTVYLETNNDEPRYFGTPSPEIDERWRRLIDNRYFAISEKEAKQMFGKEYREFSLNGSHEYVAGLDVLHMLHCLNTVRMHFEPEYYAEKLTYGRAHLDHCLDQIRQSLQCAADFTPIPTKFYAGLGNNFVVTDRVHTCRNFEKAQEWSERRFYTRIIPPGEGS